MGLVFRKVYLAIPAVLSAILALGFTFLAQINQPLNEKISDTIVNLYNMQSARLQFMLYVFCLFVIGVTTLIILLFKKIPDYQSQILYKWKKSSFSWIIAGILIILAISTVGSFKLPFFVSLAVGLPFIFSIFLAPSLRKWIKFIVLTAFVFYIASSYIIPLIHQYPITGVDKLLSHELHHSHTVLPGVDLIRGERLENSASYLYGFLVALAVPVTSALTGLPPSDPLIAVRAVQLFNILASLLVILIVFLHLPIKWKWLSLLALPLNPSFSLAHPSVSTPNQAGVRYMVLLIGILVLTLINRRHRDTGVWLLGILGGILIALNLELGICVNSGFIAFLFVRSLSNKSGLLRTIALYILSTFSVFLVSSFVLIASFTSNTDFSSLTFFFTLFAGRGYGGAASEPEFLAVCAFFIAASVITLVALRFSCDLQEKENDNAFAFSISVIILTWLPYYVNRMDGWNLSIIPFLVLLIALTFRDDAFDPIPFSASPLRLSASVILPLTLASSFVGTKLSAIWTRQYLREIRTNQCGLLFNHKSAYCFSEDVPMRISGLNNLFKMPDSSKANYLILSPLHDTQTRILGFNQTYPWQATLSSIMKEDVKARSRWIDLNGPQFLAVPILSDSDAQSVKQAILHVSEVADGSLAYKKVGFKDGWVIYKRQP